MNLVSVGHFCDANCDVLFQLSNVKVSNKEEECIMTVPRNQKNVFWYIKVELFPTDIPGIHQANVIVKKKTTKPDLVKWHHNSLGNPAKHSILRAVKQGHIATLPGINETLVTKHLPPSIDSDKVHLQQERQGIQSTKSKCPYQHDEKYILEGHERTNVILTAIVEAPTGK